MTPTITDTTDNPVLVQSGGTINPFAGVAVDDPVFYSPYTSPESGSGVLSITLTSADGMAGNLGVLSQQTYPGNAIFAPSTGTIVEKTDIAPGDPTSPKAILDGTQFTAPIVSAEQIRHVDATVTYTHVGGATVTDSTPVVLEIVGPPTLTGGNSATAVLDQSQSYVPFATVVVNEPVATATIPEAVTVRIGTIGPQDPYPFASYLGLDGGGGTISDPNGGGSFDAGTGVFTESTQDVIGQPDGAQAVVNRLVYTPPTLANGTSRELLLDVSVNGSDGSAGLTPISVPHGLIADIEDVTNPTIVAGPSQTVTAGSSDSPFSGVALADGGTFYLGGGAKADLSAQIVVTDSGTATDADGTLSGPGLMKTGIGTYTLATGYVYGLENELQQLVFNTAAVPVNQSRTDVFNLTVTDPDTGLSATNSATALELAGLFVIGSTPVAIGTGPDAFVLKISEDADQINAQFTVSVDGVQQGGVQTATASHAAGQDQAYTIDGNFGDSSHTVSVDFLNDNGKYGVEDRNLHVDGATINGATIANSNLTEYVSGSQSFAFTGNAPQSPLPVTIGSGPDTVLFAVSEDAFQGNARFTLAVDGQQQGGIQTTTALHGSGQTQDFAVRGNFGPGAHTETVNFLNDAYGGTPDTDRNLYVQSIDYDSTPNGNGSASLYSAGPVSFLTPAPPQATSDTLTVGLTEDTYQGDAMASIALDGTTLGTPTVTFLNSSGTAQEFTFTGDFGGVAALQKLSIGFLNDNGQYGSTDRNLYVKDVSFDGATLPDASTLYTNGTVTTTFQNNVVIAPFPMQQ